MKTELPKIALDAWSLGAGAAGGDQVFGNHLSEKELTACDLFQEAIQITMEMNNSYHTPEELREIMSRLIGKKVDDTFRLFPPFYTDFGKRSRSSRYKRCPALYGCRRNACKNNKTSL